MLHDAQGFGRVSISAVGDVAGISLMTHEDQPVTVDTVPASLARLLLTVRDDKGTATFLGRDNKMLQRLPN